MVTSQVIPDALHPCQPASREAPSGAAVSVTTALCVSSAVQPAGAAQGTGSCPPVTEPPPLPSICTVSGCVLVANTARTDCEAVMSTTHAPVPVHAPSQPRNW